MRIGDKCKITINKCLVCEKVFITKRKSSKACSPSCRQALIKPYYQEYGKAYRENKRLEKKVESGEVNTVCLSCNSPFSGTANQKYCSKKCSRPRKEFSPLECLECGAVFVPKNSRGKYCSKLCGKRYSRKVR